MREIRFRGQGINGEWFYGNLALIKKKVDHIKPGSYISNSVGMPFAYQVRPGTVGQFTGLKDKNGKEIYESDIIKSDYPWMCGVVEFGEGFQGEPADGQYPYQGWHVGTQAFAGDDVSVIGNIYENPELLKGNRREDE